MTKDELIDALVETAKGRAALWLYLRRYTRERLEKRDDYELKDIKAAFTSLLLNMKPSDDIDQVEFLQLNGEVVALLAEAKLVRP